MTISEQNKYDEVVRLLNEPDPVLERLKPARTSKVKPGDRVYRWWKSNGGKNNSYDPQPLTVVRVNRVTVTVRTDQGSTFRMDPADIAGAWTDEDRSER